MKETKTQNDIEKLLDNVSQILDIFKEFKQKVLRIESLIEGKPTEGIPSIYKDLENLKEQSKQIEEKIQSINKLLQGLKQDFSESNINFEKTSQEIDLIQKEVSELKSFIKEELETLSDKIIKLEFFKENKQSINAFISWIVPLVSVGLLIFLNIIMPLVKK